MTLANLIVVTRPGYEISAASATAEMAANIVDLRGVTDFTGAGKPGSQKVFLSDAVMIDVSATDIRRAVSESDNEKLTRLVPPDVAEYIRKYRLYRNTTDA